ETFTSLTVSAVTSRVLSLFLLPLKICPPTLLLFPRCPFAPLLLCLLCVVPNGLYSSASSSAGQMSAHTATGAGRRSSARVRSAECLLHPHAICQMCDYGWVAGWLAGWLAGWR